MITNLVLACFGAALAFTINFVLHGILGSAVFSAITAFAVSLILSFVIDGFRK